MLKPLVKPAADAAQHEICDISEHTSLSGVAIIEHAHVFRVRSKIATKWGKNELHLKLKFSCPAMCQMAQWVG